MYTILTIDDSKAVRMIIKKAFKDYDVRVEEAENGYEGALQIKDLSPDLILLDIAMPRVNGVALLKAIKKKPAFKKTPVIMITAESKESVIRECIEAGIRDYIIKPFSEEQIVAKVSKVLKISENIIIG